MRAGHDDRPDLLGADQRGRVERPHGGRLGDQQKGGFERRGRLAPARAGLLQRGRGVSAGHAGAAAERDRRRVRMSDDAARHHVGAVADARGVMPDGGSGDAEPLQIIEPGNPGLVAPDPGIVEDRRRNAQLRREIGGINAAMRTVDDNRSRRLGSDTGDAVGDEDRRKLCDRQSSLPNGVTCRSCREHEAKNSHQEGTGQLAMSISDVTL